jgi:hypothetical protein
MIKIFEEGGKSMSHSIKILSQIKISFFCIKVISYGRKMAALAGTLFFLFSLVAVHPIPLSNAVPASSYTSLQELSKRPDFVKCLEVDAEGNVYVACSSYSNYRLYDCVVIKYDTDGHILGSSIQGFCRWRGCCLCCCR